MHLVERGPAISTALFQQLRTLGVQPGGVLLVHCAFSRVAAGSPAGLIDALLAAADARLARSRDIVDAALEHLLEDETVFLHAAGHPCGECCAARLSIPASPVRQ